MRRPPLKAAQVLLLCCPVQGAAGARWALSDSYVGPDFFSKWNFHARADPTHGMVEYVDYATAVSEGLVKAASDRVYMGASMASGLQGTKRRSVRIESASVFNEGLFIVTLDHIPTGCGTWPAFWMFGENAEHVWPSWGEYDIIEGVHTGTRSSTALHTTAGCDQSSVNADWNLGFSKPADNCDINAQGQFQNQGCSQQGPQNSMGAEFNRRGGGTYAAEWDPAGLQIRTWFFPAGAQPADIRERSAQPDSWGAPFSRFTLGDAVCPANHFVNMRLVFDLTFCGDLGNPTFAESCPDYAAMRITCEDLVSSQPQPEAYWSIRAFDVYQRDRGISLSRICFAVLTVTAMVGAAVYALLKYGNWRGDREHPQQQRGHSRHRHSSPRRVHQHWETAQSPCGAQDRHVRGAWQAVASSAAEASAHVRDAPPEVSFSPYRAQINLVSVAP